MTIKDCIAPGDSIFCPRSYDYYSSDHCYGQDDDPTEFTKTLSPVTIIRQNSSHSSRSGADDNEDPNDSISEKSDDDQAVLVPASTSYPDTEGGTSTLGTIFLIVNAALGAGLLNLPKAFDQAGGVVTAVLVQAMLLVFIMLALLILAQTANIDNSATLQEVMHTVAGVWGRRATSVIVTVYCFGSCITFLIIIGDQFDRAFASLVGSEYCHTWYYNRDFVMPASSFLLILPLCYTKKIDFLKYASAFGVFIIIYVVVLIFVEYATGDHVPGPIKTKPDDWVDVFSVIPVICFGYQCHVSIIPIYSCMKHRNIKHFSVASTSAIAICVFTYTGAATFGYLTFGSTVSEDILTNYNAKKPSVMIALVAMGLKTYATYPILLFCGREGLSSIVKDLFVKDDTPSKEKTRRYTIATIWFVATILLAIEIPNIGAVIHVLGSFAAIFIFVFPGVCLLQTTLTKDFNLSTTKSRLTIILALSFVVLGFFLFGVVLTQGIITDLSPASTESPPLCETEARGFRFYFNLFNVT
eukprot:GFUD01002206.1.p1 GENE.GFUD01002206.1~~GFUD01002206.1.p1  ORF type:complete len:526 (-),score=56.45 GFUD01002206.1:45-1622(-)